MTSWALRCCGGGPPLSLPPPPGSISRNPLPTPSSSPLGVTVNRALLNVHPPHWPPYDYLLSLGPAIPLEEECHSSPSSLLIEQVEEDYWFVILVREFVQVSFLEKERRNVFVSRIRVLENVILRKFHDSLFIYMGFYMWISALEECPLEIDRRSKTPSSRGREI